MIKLLKMMAEVNGLRLLALLCYENLRISNFTFVLGQSQSLISWHLRLLYEARLMACYQEGKRFILSFVIAVIGLR